MTAEDIANGRDDLMTSTQVAELLQVSQRWVWDAAADRTLPSFKVGRSLRFSRAEITAWLQANRTEAKA